MKKFKVMFRPEPEGGYTFLVPSLPGCISYGETMEEAKKNGTQALKDFLACLKNHNECCTDDSGCFFEEIGVEDE